MTKEAIQPSKPIILNSARTTNALLLINLKKKQVKQSDDTSITKIYVLAKAPYLLSHDSMHIYRQIEYLPLAAPLMR